MLATSRNRNNTKAGTIAGVNLDMRFSPFDQTTTPFLALVERAKHSIFIVIYGFTLRPLVDLLIAKHESGVEVGIILDHSQSEGKAEREQVQRLLDAGVPLLIGTSPSHGQILHSKFAVVDDVDVETGSWNFSASASEQSNTMMLIEGHPNVGAIFLRHYDRLRAVILAHEHQFQLAGEVSAPLALPEDAQIDTTTHDDPPASTSTPTPAALPAAPRKRAPRRQKQVAA